MESSLLETSSNQMNLSDKFKCQYCCQQYNNQSGLITHIRRKHSTTFTDYKLKFSHLYKVEKREKKLSLNELARRKRDEKAIDDGLQVLKCEICNYESYYSLISHIVRKHGVAMNEYRSNFPSAVVQQVTSDVREKNRKNATLHLSDPIKKANFLKRRSFPSEMKHWINKGFSSDEAKKKVAEFQQAIALKGNNEKTKAKQSIRNSGQNNPMSLTSISKRLNVSKDDASKLTPCYGRSGIKHPMFGKKHSIEALNKIGQHINHTGRSKIEHEMSDLIISLYGGLKNVGVNGWCCDYVNHDRQIIVEFFGDYWHHNPEKYDRNFVNNFTKRSSEEVWLRDARKLNELRESGFNVVVIWESDWRNKKEDSLNRIKDAFNRTL